MDKETKAAFSRLIGVFMNKKTKIANEAFRRQQCSRRWSVTEDARTLVYYLELDRFFCGEWPDYLLTRKYRLACVAIMRSWLERPEEEIERFLQSVEHFADNGYAIITYPDTPLTLPTTVQSQAWQDWCLTESITGVASFAYYSGKKENLCLDIIRDIFGNPFTETEVAITPLTIQLAKDIYLERDFSRLPILADALEEAGCSDQQVLNHCRKEACHHKGCWVVDKILFHENTKEGFKLYTFHKRLREGKNPFTGEPRTS